MTACRAISAGSHPGMMKQILLRVPAVFAKIRFGKLTQPLRRRSFSTRKIMLP
jgi:hypothetical protein